MRIGFPHQASDSERRVAITPDIAKRYVGAGLEVVVEAAAGEAAGHGDHEYVEAGATIDDAWNADVVVVLARPSIDQVRVMAKGTMLIGLLSPYDDPTAIAEIATSGVTTLAFETLPRTTRAQSMDVLSSQATLAGYQMVLEAASRLPRLLPMLTTAAGTLRPATVIVLGAGVAGLQAIATARRLGAVVKAFDVRAAAAEQVESLGATFINVELEIADASAGSGYAKELTADDAARLVEGLQPLLHSADVVITAAAIPGRPAPLLVAADTVHSMPKGSVIVDGSAATGGNCELTQPGEEIRVGGVTILGPLDLPSRIAGHASQMFARNAYELVTHATSGELADDDEIMAGVTLTRDGEVVNERIKALLGSPT